MLPTSIIDIVSRGPSKKLKKQKQGSTQKAMLLTRVRCSHQSTLPITLARGMLVRGEAHLLSHWYNRQIEVEFDSMRGLAPRTREAFGDCFQQ